MRPRRTMVIGRVLMLCLLLAPVIAGLHAGAPALAADATKVRFAFWGDPAEQAAYEELVAQFEAAHPQIDIEVDYTASQSDYQTKLSTDFAGAREPGVFLINYRRFGQYAARGALQPVQPYLEASTTISADDYYDTALDAFRYRGGDLTCLPQNISSLVVYYNPDLFTAAGVPLPADGWTLDDFTAAASALTQDTDGDGAKDIYGLVVEPSLIRYAPFIWGAGGDIVDDVDNPTTLTLDTPEALAGIEWMVNLGATGLGVVPLEAEVVAEDNESRFMRGGAAMLIQSRRIVPTLREVEGLNWDVAPLPVGKQAANVLHSDAFCMSARLSDAEKQAAWTFIEFAGGRTGQELLARTGRTVPSMKAVAESPIFLTGRSEGETGEALAPANSQVFLDNIAIIRRVPSISTWPEIEDAFNQGLKWAFYVEMDIPGAIQSIVVLSQQAFARAAEEDGVGG